MTGLRLDSDKLIEVAALVTDSQLNVLGDGVDVVIHADEESLAAMPDVVATMHKHSGLTEEVRRSTVSVAEAEKMVLGLHPHAHTCRRFGAARRQLDCHRSRLHRARHARPRHLPALPDDRRQFHQRNCAAAGIRGSTSASPRRASRIVRSPTSRSRSGSCSTTAEQLSSQSPALPPRRSPRSHSSCPAPSPVRNRLDREPPGTLRSIVLPVTGEQWWL